MPQLNSTDPLLFLCVTQMELNLPMVSAEQPIYICKAAYNFKAIIYCIATAK